MQKKLEYFTEAIMREVEAKRRRERHQLANDISKETAAALEAAGARGEAKTKAAYGELRREANRKAAAAAKAAKAEYASRRKARTAQLFEAVLSDLEAFTKSAEYEAYLIERIKKVMTGRDFAFVKLSPEDMRFGEQIHKATGLAAEEGNADCVGGFILLNEARTRRADFTFKARLNEVIKRI